MTKGADPKKPTGKESVDFVNESLNGELKPAAEAKIELADVDDEGEIQVEEIALSEEDGEVIYSAFEEAAKVKTGLGLTAVGLKRILEKEGDSDIFLLIRRKMQKSTLGEKREMENVFLMTRNGKQYFTSSQGLVASIDNIKSVEDGAFNYLYIRFDGKGQTKDGLSINRYYVELRNPGSVTARNNQQKKLQQNSGS